MSKPIARTGICQGGPLNAAVHTERDKRSFSPDMTGTYYYREASGPTPGIQALFSAVSIANVKEGLHAHLAGSMLIAGFWAIKNPLEWRAVRREAPTSGDLDRVFHPLFYSWELAFRWGRYRQISLVGLVDLYASPHFHPR